MTTTAAPPDYRRLEAEHPALAAVAVRAGTANASQRAQLAALLTADGQPPAGPGAPSPTPGPATPPAQAGQPEPQQRPEVVPAVAGAAAPERDEAVQVLYEPSVYGQASSHSLVRDAFRARMDGDVEAAGRLLKFQAECRDLRASIERRGSMATAGNNPGTVATRPNFGEVIPPGYRGDLLISPHDPGRPLVSHLGGVPLSDATPFRIPVEREFEGVGAHTEGTAHVQSGTLDLDEVTVTPRAVSGAFRISREMVDASNPALDQIAVRAMRRDYNRKAEAYALAGLVSVRATGEAVTGGRDVEEALNDFTEENHDAIFGIAGRTMRKALSSEEVGDGRKRYPYLGPSNAGGTTDALFRGLDVQGLPLLSAPVVDDPDAWLVDATAVLWAESSLLLFRFDEVEGPGVIKLALFGYQAVKVTRESGVKRLTLDETP